jgi:hypothetical protein
LGWRKRRVKNRRWRGLPISSLLVDVCHLKEESNIQVQKVELAEPLQEQQEWEVQELEVEEQEGQKQEEEGGTTSVCC